MDRDFKVVVKLKRRPDGGLRAWSDDVPGLVLSSRDPEDVLADIGPALEVILSEMLGCEVKARPLDALPRSEPATLLDRWAKAAREHLSTRLEFAAQPCAA